MSVSRKIIEEVRGVTKLSVNKLATETNLPRSTIANIQSGLNKDFSAEAGLKLLSYAAEHTSKQNFLAVMTRIFDYISDHERDK